MADHTVSTRQAQNGSKKSQKKTRGPQAERVKIRGNWKDAIKTALGKKLPPGGVPEK